MIMARAFRKSRLGPECIILLRAAEALPTPIAESFHERFGIRLLSCYHTTQAGPLAVDRAGKEPESVGRAFEGVELRVASPKGTTQAGLAILDTENVLGDLIAATINAAFRRGVELADEARGASLAEAPSVH